MRTAAVLMSLLVLSASDVEQVISHFTPDQLQTLIARVFSCSSGPPPSQSSTPHRTSIATPNHTALFMPARLSGYGLQGTTIKVVCVPQNPADSHGLPGSTLVLDEATGVVKAIVNARNLTPLRNAAGSLLSTNLIGPKSPTSLVAFGAGKQIEAHLNLHLKSFPSIHKCTIINRSLNQRVQALKHRIEPFFPAVSFQWMANTPVHETNQNKLEIAISNASLIICATSSTSPLFPSSWVRSGTHIILIGSYTPSMREVDRELVQRAISKPSQRSCLVVDSRAACAVEAGELIDAGVSGSQMVEIGELVRFTEGDEGELKLDLSVGFRDEEEGEGGGQGEVGVGPITMFKSVGVGLQDVAIACAVVQKAEEMGLGNCVAGYDS